MSSKTEIGRREILALIVNKHQRKIDTIADDTRLEFDRITQQYQADVHEIVREHDDTLRRIVATHDQKMKSFKAMSAELEPMAELLRRAAEVDGRTEISSHVLQELQAMTRRGLMETITQETQQAVQQVAKVDQATQDLIRTKSSGASGIPAVRETQRVALEKIERQTALSEAEVEEQVRLWEEEDAAAAALAARPAD